MSEIPWSWILLMATVTAAVQVFAAPTESPREVLETTTLNMMNVDDGITTNHVTAEPVSMSTESTAEVFENEIENEDKNIQNSMNDSRQFSLDVNEKYALPDTTEILTTDPATNILDSKTTETGFTLTTESIAVEKNVEKATSDAATSSTTIDSTEIFGRFLDDSTTQLTTFEKIDDNESLLETTVNLDKPSEPTTFVAEVSDIASNDGVLNAKTDSNTKDNLESLEPITVEAKVEELLPNSKYTAHPAIDGAMSSESVQTTSVDGVLDMKTDSTTMDNLDLSEPKIIDVKIQELTPNSMYTTNSAFDSATESYGAEQTTPLDAILDKKTDSTIINNLELSGLKTIEVQEPEMTSNSQQTTGSTFDIPINTEDSKTDSTTIDNLESSGLKSSEVKVPQIDVNSQHKTDSAFDGAMSTETTQLISVDGIVDTKTDSTIEDNLESPGLKTNEVKEPEMSSNSQYTRGSAFEDARSTETTQIISVDGIVDTKTDSTPLDSLESSGLKSSEVKVPETTSNSPYTTAFDDAMRTETAQTSSIERVFNTQIDSTTMINSEVSEPQIIEVKVQKVTSNSKHTTNSALDGEISTKTAQTTSLMDSTNSLLSQIITFKNEFITTPQTENVGSMETASTSTPTTTTEKPQATTTSTTGAVTAKTSKTTTDSNFAMPAFTELVASTEKTTSEEFPSTTAAISSTENSEITTTTSTTTTTSRTETPTPEETTATTELVTSNMKTTAITPPDTTTSYVRTTLKSILEPVTTSTASTANYYAQPSTVTSSTPTSTSPPPSSRTNMADELEQLLAAVMPEFTSQPHQIVRANSHEGRSLNIPPRIHRLLNEDGVEVLSGYSIVQLSN